MGNGSTAAAEVVIKEGITKEMLVTTSFFYRRERDNDWGDSCVMHCWKLLE